MVVALENGKSLVGVLLDGGITRFVAHLLHVADGRFHGEVYCRTRSIFTSPLQRHRSLLQSSSVWLEFPVLISGNEIVHDSFLSESSIRRRVVQRGIYLPRASDAHHDLCRVAFHKRIPHRKVVVNDEDNFVPRRWVGLHIECGGLVPTFRRQSSTPIFHFPILLPHRPLSFSWTL